MPSKSSFFCRREAQLIPFSFAGSVSPDGGYFVIPNVSGVFDLYSILTGVHLASLSFADSVDKVGPCVFTHNGNAILGAVGARAKLWDVKTHLGFYDFTVGKSINPTESRSNLNFVASDGTILLLAVRRPPPCRLVPLTSMVTGKLQPY